MSLHDAVSTVSQSSSIPYSTRSDSGSDSGISSSICSSSVGIFAAGIACGAALGLVLSSTRGSQVRATVRDYASQGSERLQELASSSRHWAEDTLHQAMSALEQGRRAFSSSSSGSVGDSSLTASISDRLSSSGRSIDDLSGI